MFGFKEVEIGIASILGSVISGVIYLLLVLLTELNFNWFGPLGNLLQFVMEVI